MTGSIRTVEADRHPRHTASEEPLNGSFVQEGRGARSNGGPKTETDTPHQERKEIGPLQRIAARNNHLWIAKRADRLQQSRSFFGRQFERIALRHGAGATVHAGEVARLGQLPNHQERGVIEVLHCHFPSVSFAMTSKWSFSVGGGPTTCRATSLVSALNPRASPAGTKITAPAWTASWVSSHYLPITLQDDQHHIDTGSMDRDELTRFQASEHCLNMCAGCYEHRVESLRPECDRIAVRTKNSRHGSRLRVPRMFHSDSGHARRIPIPTSRPNTQAWTSSLFPSE